MPGSSLFGPDSTVATTVMSATCAFARGSRQGASNYCASCFREQHSSQSKAHNSSQSQAHNSSQSKAHKHSSPSQAHIRLS